MAISRERQIERTKRCWNEATTGVEGRRQKTSLLGAIACP